MSSYTAKDYLDDFVAAYNKSASSGKTGSELGKAVRSSLASNSNAAAFDAQNSASATKDVADSEVDDILSQLDDQRAERVADYKDRMEKYAEARDFSSSVHSLDEENESLNQDSSENQTSYTDISHLQKDLILAGDHSDTVASRSNGEDADTRVHRITSENKDELGTEYYPEKETSSDVSVLDVFNAPIFPSEDDITSSAIATEDIDTRLHNVSSSSELSDAQESLTYYSGLMQTDIDNINAASEDYNVQAAIIQDSDSTDDEVADAWAKLEDDETAIRNGRSDYLSHYQSFTDAHNVVANWSAKDGQSSELESIKSDLQNSLDLTTAYNTALESYNQIYDYIKSNYGEETGKTLALQYNIIAYLTGDDYYIPGDSLDKYFDYDTSSFDSYTPGIDHVAGTESTTAQIEEYLASVSDEEKQYLIDNADYLKDFYMNLIGVNGIYTDPTSRISAFTDDEYNAYLAPYLESYNAAQSTLSDLYAQRDEISQQILDLPNADSDEGVQLQAEYSSILSQISDVEKTVSDGPYGSLSRAERKAIENRDTSTELAESAQADPDFESYAALGEGDTTFTPTSGSFFDKTIDAQLIANSGSSGNSTSTTANDYMEYMTPEQQQIYNYYVGKKDYDSAQSYYSSIESSLSAQYLMDLTTGDNGIEAYSKEHPVTSIVANAFSQAFVAPTVGLINTAETLISGNSSALSRAITSSNTYVQQGVAENLTNQIDPVKFVRNFFGKDYPDVNGEDDLTFSDEAASFWAGTAVSMANNVAQMLPFALGSAFTVEGKLASSLAGATEEELLTLGVGAEEAAAAKQLNAINEWVPLIVMGTDAATSTFEDRYNQGDSLAKSFVYSCLAGSVEVFTEKIGVDTWLDSLEGNAGGILGGIIDGLEKRGVKSSLVNAFISEPNSVNRSALRGVLKTALLGTNQALSEGGEEVLSNILDFILDIGVSAVTGDESDYISSVKEYLTGTHISGYEDDGTPIYDKRVDMDTARRLALEDFASDTIDAFKGGFVSGLGFGVASVPKMIRGTAYAGAASLKTGSYADMTFVAENGVDGNGGQGAFDKSTNTWKMAHEIQNIIKSGGKVNRFMMQDFIDTFNSESRTGLAVSKNLAADISDGSEKSLSTFESSLVSQANMTVEQAQKATALVTNAIDGLPASRSDIQNLLNNKQAADLVASYLGYTPSSYSVTEFRAAADRYSRISDVIDKNGIASSKLQETLRSDYRAAIDLAREDARGEVAASVNEAQANAKTSAVENVTSSEAENPIVAAARGKAMNVAENVSTAANVETKQKAIKDGITVDTSNVRSSDAPLDSSVVSDADNPYSKVNVLAYVAEHPGALYSNNGTTFIKMPIAGSPRFAVFDSTGHFDTIGDRVYSTPDSDAADNRAMSLLPHGQDAIDIINAALESRSSKSSSDSESKSESEPKTESESKTESKSESEESPSEKKSRLHFDSFAQIYKQYVPKASLKSLRYIYDRDVRDAVDYGRAVVAVGNDRYLVLEQNLSGDLDSSILTFDQLYRLVHLNANSSISNEDLKLFAADLNDTFDKALKLGIPLVDLNRNSFSNAEEMQAILQMQNDAINNTLAAQLFARLKHDTLWQRDHTSPDFKFSEEHPNPAAELAVIYGKRLLKGTGISDIVIDYNLGETSEGKLLTTKDGHRVILINGQLTSAAKLQLAESTYKGKDIFTRVSALQNILSVISHEIGHEMQGTLDSEYAVNVKMKTNDIIEAYFNYVNRTSSRAIQILDMDGKSRTVNNKNGPLFDLTHVDKLKERYLKDTQSGYDRLAKEEGSETATQATPNIANQELASDMLAEMCRETGFLVSMSTYHPNIVRSFIDSLNVVIDNITSLLDSKLPTGFPTLSSDTTHFFNSSRAEAVRLQRTMTKYLKENRKAVDQFIHQDSDFESVDAIIKAVHAKYEAQLAAYEKAAADVKVISPTDELIKKNAEQEQIIRDSSLVEDYILKQLSSYLQYVHVFKGAQFDAAINFFADFMADAFGEEFLATDPFALDAIHDFRDSSLALAKELRDDHPDYAQLDPKEKHKLIVESSREMQRCFYAHGLGIYISSAQGLSHKESGSYYASLLSYLHGLDEMKELGYNPAAIIREHRSHMLEQIDSQIDHLNGELVKSSDESQNASFRSEISNLVTVREEISDKNLKREYSDAVLKWLEHNDYWSYNAAAVQAGARSSDKPTFEHFDWTALLTPDFISDESLDAADEELTEELENSIPEHAPTAARDLVEVRAQKSLPEEERDSTALYSDASVSHIGDKNSSRTIDRSSDLYIRAVNLALDQGYLYISDLQKSLNLSRARASLLLNQLCHDGIIDDSPSVRKRGVRISREDWENALSDSEESENPSSVMDSFVASLNQPAASSADQSHSESNTGLVSYDFGIYNDVLQHCVSSEVYFYLVDLAVRDGGLDDYDIIHNSSHLQYPSLLKYLQVDGVITSTKENVGGMKLYRTILPASVWNKMGKVAAYLIDNTPLPDTNFVSELNYSSVVDAESDDSSLPSYNDGIPSSVAPAEESPAEEAPAEEAPAEEAPAEEAPAEETPVVEAPVDDTPIGASFRSFFGVDDFHQAMLDSVTKWVDDNNLIAQGIEPVSLSIDVINMLPVFNLSALVKDAPTNRSDYSGVRATRQWLFSQIYNSLRSTSASTLPYQYRVSLTQHIVDGLADAVAASYNLDSQADYDTEFSLETTADELYETHSVGTREQYQAKRDADRLAKKAADDALIPSDPDDDTDRIDPEVIEPMIADTVISNSTDEDLTELAFTPLEGELSETPADAGVVDDSQTVPRPSLSDPNFSYDAIKKSYFEYTSESVAENETPDSLFTLFYESIAGTSVKDLAAASSEIIPRSSRRVSDHFINLAHNKMFTDSTVTSLPGEVLEEKFGVEGKTNRENLEEAKSRLDADEKAWLKWYDDLKKKESWSVADLYTAYGICSHLLTLSNDAQLDKTDYFDWMSIIVSHVSQAGQILQAVQIFSKTAVGKLNEVLLRIDAKTHTASDTENSFSMKYHHDQIGSLRDQTRISDEEYAALSLVLDASDEKYHSLINQLARLLALRSSAKARITEAQAHNEQANIDLQNAITALQSDCSARIRELYDVRHQSTDIRKAIREKQLELNRSLRSVHDSTNSEVVANLRSDLVELKLKLKQLREKEADLSAEASKLASQISDKEQERMSEDEELQKIIEALNKSHQDIMDKQAEIEDLLEKRKDAQYQLEVNSFLGDQLDARMKNIAAETRKVTGEAEVASGRVDAIQKRIDALNNLNATLEDLVSKYFGDTEPNFDYKSLVRKIEDQNTILAHLYDGLTRDLGSIHLIKDSRVELKSNKVKDFFRDRAISDWCKQHLTDAASYAASFITADERQHLQAEAYQIALSIDKSRDVYESLMDSGEFTSESELRANKEYQLAKDDLVDEIVRINTERGFKPGAFTVNRLKNQNFGYLNNFAIASLANYFDDFVERSFAEKLSSWQYIAQLFNIKTAKRNAIANVLFLSFESLNEVSIGRALDSMMGHFTGLRTTGVAQNADDYEKLYADAIAKGDDDLARWLRAQAGSPLLSTYFPEPTKDQMSSLSRSDPDTKKTLLQSVASSAFGVSMNTALDRGARSYLENRLDVNVFSPMGSNSYTKYADAISENRTSNRTYKMREYEPENASAPIISLKFAKYKLHNAAMHTLSHLEMLNGFTLSTVDEMCKGYAYQHTINTLAQFVCDPKFNLSMEEAEAAAIRYMKYVTFQDDTRLGIILEGIHKVLNLFSLKTYAYDQFGNQLFLDKDGHETIDPSLAVKKVYNNDIKFGLGDIVIKYRKVPASIIMRSIELTPAGLYKVVKVLFTARERAKISGKKGLQFDMQTQRDFVMALSNVCSGSTILGLLTWLALNGVITKPDDEDQDKKFLMFSIGSSDLQFNLTKLKHLFNGDNKEYFDQKFSDEDDYGASYYDDTYDPFVTEAEDSVFNADFAQPMTGLAYVAYELAQAIMEKGGDDLEGNYSSSPWADWLGRNGFGPMVGAIAKSVFSEDGIKAGLSGAANQFLDLNMMDILSDIIYNNVEANNDWHTQNSGKTMPVDTTLSIAGSSTLKTIASSIIPSLTPSLLYQFGNAIDNTKRDQYSTEGWIRDAYEDDSSSINGILSKLPSGVIDTLQEAYNRFAVSSGILRGTVPAMKDSYGNDITSHNSWGFANIFDSLFSATKARTLSDDEISNLMIDIGSRAEEADIDTDGFYLSDPDYIYTSVEDAFSNTYSMSSSDKDTWVETRGSIASDITSALYDNGFYDDNSLEDIVDLQSFVNDYAEFKANQEFLLSRGVSYEDTIASKKWSSFESVLEALNSTSDADNEYAFFKDAYDIYSVVSDSDQLENYYPELSTAAARYAYLDEHTELSDAQKMAVYNIYASTPAVLKTDDYGNPSSYFVTDDDGNEIAIPDVSRDRFEDTYYSSLDALQQSLISSDYFHNASNESKGEMLDEATKYAKYIATQELVDNASFGTYTSSTQEKYSSLMSIIGTEENNYLDGFAGAASVIDALSSDNVNERQAYYETQGIYDTDATVKADILANEFSDQYDSGTLSRIFASLYSENNKTVAKVKALISDGFDFETVSGIMSTYDTLKESGTLPQFASFRSSSDAMNEQEYLVSVLRSSYGLDDDAIDTVTTQFTIDSQKPDYIAENLQKLTGSDAMSTSDALEVTELVLNAGEALGDTATSSEVDEAEIKFILNTSKLNDNQKIAAIAGVSGEGSAFSYIDSDTAKSLMKIAKSTGSYELLTSMSPSTSYTYSGTSYKLTDAAKTEYSYAYADMLDQLSDGITNSDTAATVKKIASQYAKYVALERAGAKPDLSDTSSSAFSAYRAYSNAINAGASSADYLKAVTLLSGVTKKKEILKIIKANFSKDFYDIYYYKIGNSGKGWASSTYSY